MSGAPANGLFTAPNLLSLSRLPLGWVVWVALGPTPTAQNGALARGVMGLAAAPDVLDGYLARRRGRLRRRHRFGWHRRIGWYGRLCWQRRSGQRW